MSDEAGTYVPPGSAKTESPALAKNKGGRPKGIKNPPRAAAPTPAPRATVETKIVAPAAEVAETYDVEGTRDFATMADQESASEHAERIRAARKPFGAMEQKLAYPQRNGYHRHWFNDHPGRIADAKAAGYDHVLGVDKKPVKRPVGTGREGGVLMGYLMEIPEELWQEDMAREQLLADRVDQSIARGRPITSEGETDTKEASHFYSPLKSKVVHGTGKLRT